MNPPKDYQPKEYLSYNALSRRPMVWGVPYMAGLFITCVFLLGGVLLGTLYGPVGWLFTLIAIPVIYAVKMASIQDDRALEIILLQVKWSINKALGGNAHYYNGLLTIAPINYGRKQRYIKHYFERQRTLTKSRN